MSYSAKNSISSDLKDLSGLSPGTRAFFQARLKRRLYTLVIEKFQRAEREGLTKAELARRIGKKPEVITRALQTPGNWRLETVSDLLLGISGEELVVAATSPLDGPPRNHRGEDIPLPKAQPFSQPVAQTSSAGSAYTMTIITARKEDRELVHAE